jgi:sugar phosphate permease
MMVGGNDTVQFDRTPDRSRRAYGYAICASIFLSYLLVYFHRVSPSVLALDMQRAFGVEATLLGALGSAYFYAYAVMQLPVGILVDSWGARKTVSSFLLLAAVGSLLMGVTRSIGIAIAGRLLVGIGVSAVFVSNFKLLAEWFRPRQMAILGGLFMTVGGIGVFSASIPLAALSNRLGWNWTLVSVGILTVAMSALVFIVVRNRPSEKGLPGISGLQGSSKAGSRFAGFLTVLRSIRFWPLALWAGLNNGVAFAIGSMWSVPYLQHVYGMNKARASRYQAMFGAALIVGSPLLAFLSNRIGRKPVVVGSSLLLTLVLALFVAFTGTLPLWTLYPLLFLLFLGGNATGPTSAIVAKELFDPGTAGTSVGLVNCFPFFIGGLYQVFMGTILDRSGTYSGIYLQIGYQRIFLMGLASAFLSLVAAVFVRETLSPPQEQ